MWNKSVSEITISCQHIGHFKPPWRFAAEPFFQLQVWICGTLSNFSVHPCPLDSFHEPPEWTCRHVLDPSSPSWSCAQKQLAKDNVIVRSLPEGMLMHHSWLDKQGTLFIKHGLWAFYTQSELSLRYVGCKSVTFLDRTPIFDSSV